MANLHAAQLEESGPSGFRARRAKLGREAGSEHLGASLWEIEPGQAAYPYHYHLAEEELVVVLSGRPSLRTPAGWRELEEGEVVAFPVGAAGAHQIANRGSETVRFLSFSQVITPEVAVYPDSGKVGIYDDRHVDLGAPPLDPSIVDRMFRLADAVDYWEGEQPG